MIQYMATKSNKLKATQECGRLIIFDAKRVNVGNIPEDELAFADIDDHNRFLVVLVAFHLCKIFKGSTVDEVKFPQLVFWLFIWREK